MIQQTASPSSVFQILDHKKAACWLQMPINTYKSVAQAILPPVLAVCKYGGRSGRFAHSKRTTNTYKLAKIATSSIYTLLVILWLTAAIDHLFITLLQPNNQCVSPMTNGMSRVLYICEFQWSPWDVSLSLFSICTYTLIYIYFTLCRPWTSISS